jgi:hypothetical protein
MQQQSISQRLRDLVRNLPQNGTTLSDLLHQVGNDGLLVLTAMLTLVFLIPVSIPGVSTVFGAAILLIGASRFLRRELWLPASIRHRNIQTKKLRPVIRKALPWLKKVEYLSRPNRIPALVANGTAEQFNNLALVLGAILLMLPFGPIPFTNTLPALALLFLAIGLLQRDGVCVLLGYLSFLATFVYFGVLIAGSGWAARAAFSRMMG